MDFPGEIRANKVTKEPTSTIMTHYDPIMSKHAKDQVFPSHRVTIVDVLDQIEEKISVIKGSQ